MVGGRIMNSRQRQIIDILHDQEKWITGKELARILDVSDRTIRSDIESIEEKIVFSGSKQMKEIPYL